MNGYLRNVSTLHFDPELCNGCGRCLEVCPHGVFRRNGGAVEVQNRDRCIECGACMMNCAAGAVHVEAGVGCAAAILNGMLRRREPSCGCDTTDCCC